MLIHDDPTIADPHIKMRTVRVMFSESQYNYQTTINGTRAEIAAYFRGASLNVANYPEENTKSPVRLEFPPERDGEPTIAIQF